MPSQSAAAPPSQTMSEIAGLTAIYQPGICGDGFNNYESLDNVISLIVFFFLVLEYYFASEYIEIILLLEKISLKPVSQ